MDREKKTKDRGKLRVLQIGKQCKQGPVHSFSRFPLRCNLRKLLVGAASPIPFERYLRYRLLVHSERFPSKNNYQNKE